MAIVSDFVEDAKPSSSTKPFNTVLDPSKPLEFLEKALDFLANESDLFKSDSSVNDVNAVARKVKDKVIAEEKVEKEPDAVKNEGKIEKDGDEKMPEAGEAKDGKRVRRWRFESSISSSTNDTRKQLEQARHQQQIRDAARAEKNVILRKNVNLFSLESPFTRDIEEYPKPAGFKLPKLEPYDGKSDPEDLLNQYITHMTLFDTPDPMMCKAFPVFLTGRALQWFRKFTPRSIPDWPTLASKFMYAFIAFRPFQRNAIHLQFIKQKEDETVLQFMKRFNDESMLVQGDEQIKVVSFISGLREAPLYAKLNRKMPQSMEECLEKTYKYCQGEDSIRLKIESDRWYAEKDKSEGRPGQKRARVWDRTLAPHHRSAW